MVGVLAWLLLGFVVGTGVGYCVGCALYRVGQAASAESQARSTSVSQPLTIKPPSRRVRVPSRLISLDDEE